MTKVAAEKNRSKIAPCNCKHEYQDEKYGNGRRVHTVHVKKTKEGPDVVSCTVCGTKRTLD